MTIPNTFDAAEGAYVVANTPLFLLRKLMSDPSVIALAHDTPSDDLFNNLIAAASQQPTTLADKVLPFILLIALAIKGDLRLITRALALRPDAKPHWFNYLAGILLERPSSYGSQVSPHSVSRSWAAASPCQGIERNP